MQGHFEGSQPSPYANISVNNPSRYTNSNLVNRRYCIDQPQETSPTPPMPIKPVIPRRRTANNVASSGASAQPQMIAAQMVPSTSSMMNQMLINQDTSSDVVSLRSPSPTSSHLHSASSATHTPIPQNFSQLDIKPNIQNLPQYNGGAGTLVGPNNLEIATLFFNQNFNQPSGNN